MTITIHRPIWLQRPAIWLGLAAILTAATVAVFQNTGTDPADVGASNASAATITPSSAAQKAFLDVQDDYLPPTVGLGSAARKAFLDVQDDYLPPTVAPESGDLEANGLGDNRTSGPR